MRNEKKSRMISRGKKCWTGSNAIEKWSFRFLQHKTLHTIWRICFFAFRITQVLKIGILVSLLLLSFIVRRWSPPSLNVHCCCWRLALSATHLFMKSKSYTFQGACSRRCFYLVKKKREEDKTFCARTFEVECGVWRIHFSSPSAVAGVSEWAMLAYEMKK